MAWIPGHCGILGNEIADSWAKQAVIFGNDDNYVVYAQDLDNYSFSHLRSSWNSLWQVSKKVKGKFYGHLQPDIPPKPWFFKFKNIEKSISSSICRMRLGHCCSPVFLNKIKIRDHSLCECGLDEGSIDHILFSCPKLRFSLYDCLPPTIPRPTNSRLLLSLIFSPFHKTLSKFIKINNIRL